MESSSDRQSCALILCSGDIKDYISMKRYLNRACYIICVDGGARHSVKWDIIPDVLLGDMDSITEEILEYYSNKGCPIIKYPAQKDMTDTELALEHAFEKGFEEIILLGATGERMDHSLANIFLLKRIIDNSKNGLIADEYNEIRMTKDSLVIQRDGDFRISLIAAAGRVEGIKIKGVVYPLENAILEVGSSLGISNEFAGEMAEISVKNGYLLVIKSRDK